MGAMDNLVKGAAGQAVQNMNLLFGRGRGGRTSDGAGVPVDARSSRMALHNRVAACAAYQEWLVLEEMERLRTEELMIKEDRWRRDSGERL